jgi:hypothetical protein
MTRVVRRLAGALAALAVAASLPAGSVGHAPDPSLSGGAFAANQVLTFTWRSGATPPAAHRAAILDAAEDVAQSRASKAALFELKSGAASLVGYGPDATCGPNGIACFTRNVDGDRFTMWFRPQGHRFDWGALRWCQSYDKPPNGCYDVENIALDEFGHVEGLAHHDNYSDDRDYRDAVVQTVSRTKPNDGWNAHVFGRCDVATLQRMYDATASTKISTCLDLATVLTLSSNLSRVGYGGTVGLTATLRIVDVSAAGKLGGNALNDRTVTLQRRPAGGSGWTTVATMQSGSSGTYTATAQLTSATDFRAVFASPSSEGLSGDTSPVVTVTVGSCGTPCPVRAPAT